MTSSRASRGPARDAAQGRRRTSAASRADLGLLIPRAVRRAIRRDTVSTRGKQDLQNLFRASARDQRAPSRRGRLHFSAPKQDDTGRPLATIWGDSRSTSGSTGSRAYFCLVLNVSLQPLIDASGRVLRCGRTFPTHRPPSRDRGSLGYLHGGAELLPRAARLHVVERSSGPARDR